MQAQISYVQSPFGLFGTQITYESRFRTHGVYSTCWNPLWMVLQYRVGPIRDACQNEVGHQWSPCGVFNIDSDGFDMHAEVRHIWSSFGVFVTQFPYESNFRMHGVCGTRSIPFGWNIHTNSDGFENACQNDLGCKWGPLEVFGTQVQSVPRFRTMEFIIPTRSRCGKKFNTDTDRLEMHAQMNLDSYDDHVRCLALGFTLWFDFACMEFTVPIGHRCGQKFNTDSDGFEKHGDMS